MGDLQSVCQEISDIQERSVTKIKELENESDVLLEQMKEKKAQYDVLAQKREGLLGKRQAIVNSMMQDSVLKIGEMMDEWMKIEDV